MRVNRFKMLFLLLCLVPVIWLCWQQSFTLIDIFDLQYERIKVNGTINDAASFSGLVIVSGVVVLGIISLITGKPARWVPKIVFVIFGCMVLVAFIAGWSMNITLKQKLNDKGFVECASERELALKYSSRTYVLDPSLCDKL